MEHYDIISFLKEYGKQIGVEAKQGVPEAMAIVRAYYMYYECPDPGAMGLLVGAIRDYEKSRQVNDG